MVYFNLTNKTHVIFETRSGLKLKIRVKSTDLMALTNVWLIQDYSSKDFSIKNDDIVIDVGAHIGLFALFASQYCKNGKIYCFEPVKENYDLLLDNIKLNNLTNIIPFNCAVSDKSSKVKIFLRDDEASHSMYITNSNYVEVSSMTLDDFFKETKIKKCDFLKLDCEGAEYDIIDSLTPKNFEIIERIAIECHFANSKPLLIKNLTKILEMSSFDTKTKPIFSDMGFIFATRRH
jgi:FkbM family methyltransferase